MELVGPVQLLHILATLPAQMSIAELPFWNKVAGALYVIHYFNRSIVNPLFVAPSISPARLELFLFACIFNWFNSAYIGGWIVGYDVGFAGYEANGTLLDGFSPSSVQQMVPYFGVALFAYSMINNIRAERTLWRLRREEALRRAAKKNDTSAAANGKTNIYHKVYAIPPPNGLFRWILYPHYSFEWLEWIGFVLVGLAVYPVRSGGLLMQTPSITLAPWLWPFASLANWLNLPLPLPALVFVLNNVFTMLPQARRGREWYIGKFGKDKVAGRSAVLPGIPFL
jgi:3-oxo-5-alpha-steroid 4-dehydrogenase 1